MYVLACSRQMQRIFRLMIPMHIGANLYITDNEDINVTELLIQAEKAADHLTDLYCKFHRNPETAFHEIKTNRLIREELDRIGVEYYAPSDILTVAVIRGDLPGAVVGIRCDTDALAVAEQTGLPYASENEGFMHACGHDAHITAGLGCAAILQEKKSELAGNVKIIFQPAEEGAAGADYTIETGLCDDIDVFFGVHVWSAFGLGEFHVSDITVAAAVDMFTIKIHGKGGHGATPNLCCDAIAAGADLVNSLQYIVSRALPPTEAAVLTIGSFHAGRAGNVIAGEAELMGTVRTVSSESRERSEKVLRETADSVAKYHGCTAEVIYTSSHAAVTNDRRAVEFACEAAVGLVPDDKIGPQVLRMLGDDFSAYGRIAPYCYVQVGITPDEEEPIPHHNGKFKVDESVLPLCTAWMASFAFLAGEKWK